MADAQHSKCCDRKVMWVRLPPVVLENQQVRQSYLLAGYFFAILALLITLHPFLRALYFFNPYGTTTNLR